MFISVFDLFKLGIGPSSSHTLGPMLAAKLFIEHIDQYFDEHAQSLNNLEGYSIRCSLAGSLAFTGKGHGSDTALLLGLNGYGPETAAQLSLDGRLSTLISQLSQSQSVVTPSGRVISFSFAESIQFDTTIRSTLHPNAMMFQLLRVDSSSCNLLLSQTLYSIGGGFIANEAELSTSIIAFPRGDMPFDFSSAKEMMALSKTHNLSLAQMKFENERCFRSAIEIEHFLDSVANTMLACVERGLSSDGELPGGLCVKRRAKGLYGSLIADRKQACVNDWLIAYAMAVNEENAMGHAVVTAPTNGAAGVIPAVLYYLVAHHCIGPKQVNSFLLTAATIGGLIKQRSSISGAEVGCQGEVGAASSMAAAACCAVKGGTVEQIENAAEIALEHHLGMTCDPVAGLVQVPCIERNGFGAIKAYAAASLALHGTGEHFISLDNCIKAMKQTGDEMLDKYKETSLGGLAVNWVDC